MQRRLWFLLACCLTAVPSFAAITGIVMTQEGAPVAGARVSIRAHESTEARRARYLSENPEAVPLASTQTDAKGAFSFESPKQPVVGLAISANGYLPVERRVENDEEVGAIALVKAETRTGTIRNGGGKPIANATVVLSYNGAELVAKTNEQGKYEAPDPKNRLRGLTVLHPDFAIDEKPFFAATTSASDLDRTLTPGAKLTGRVVGTDGQSPLAGATVFVDGWPVATTGEDGSFTAPHVPSKWSMLTARKDGLMGQRAWSKDAAHTIALARAATISGRVTDAKSKAPITGALVRLGGRRFMRMSGDIPYTAETDAKGNWSMTVVPGTYTVVASHPSYRPEPVEVTATAGQHVAKDVTASQLARVSGAVVDEAKRPVAGAAVAPVETADPMRGGMRFLMSDDQTVSGPDGRFSTRVELDTDLAMRATKRGFPYAQSDSFRLAAGERKSGIVLTIPTGIAVTGRVTDAQGEPLSGVAVTTAETEQGPRGMLVRTFAGMSRNDDDAVRTASDGTFTLRLKEGTYDFQFRREGFAPKTVRGQNVTYSAPPVVEATLEPASEVVGRIVRGGVGVEGVRVSAFGMGLDATAITGPDGAFTLTGLPAGPARLFLRKEDEFITEERTVTAPSRDVVIELRAGGRVTGRVTDKSGKPINAFQAGVATSRSGGGMQFLSPPQLRDFTSDDGSFVLENVPAGAVTLVASAPGYASGKLNLNIEEGKTLSDVELQLDSGVKLTGRVTGPNGGPVSGVSVRVVASPTGGFAARGMEPNTTTDDSGEYTLDTLLPGEETILFNHAKYVSTRKNVTLKGRETRLDVQLSSGLKVTGTVVTEAGAPVPDAQVEAMAPGAGMQQARTNASGTFEFDTLTPGRYRFTAYKSGLAQGTVEDIDISSGAPVRITMAAGATIYGRVTGLAAEELPLAQVDVRGVGRAGTSAPVDAQGNYRIEGAPTGTVQVSASVSSRSMLGGKSTKPQTIELAPGGSQMVDLAFRADISIRGRVTRNGVPVPSATVSFMSRGAAGFASATTDERGNYTITGVDEGTYNVEVVDMQRLSPFSTTYDVRGSATFDIDYRTGSVRGRVTEAGTNEPLANVVVQIRSTSGLERFPIPRSTSTDNAGAFVLDSVPAGSYTLSASKDGYGNDMRDLSVTDDGIENLELKLASNAGVTIRVVDERDQRPIRGFATAYDMQGRIAYDQRFMTIGGGDPQELRLPLSPGTYSISVTATNYAPRNIIVTSPSTPTVGLTPGGTLLIQSRHSEPREIRLVDTNGIPYGRVSNFPPKRALLPSPATTTWSNVAVGSYTLQLLDASGAVVESRQVVVQEGRTTNAEI